MPATKFMCPDSETIEIAKCLEVGGCRMPERCATLPYLRLIGFDREWKGVSPSSAGNGPRSLSLRSAAKKLNLSTFTVWRWCDGGMQHGRYYPPKNDCWSEKLYN